jgi:hypothetical protein
MDVIHGLKSTLLSLFVTLSFAQGAFAQEVSDAKDFQEDEFIGACIAQHKDSTNWWNPDSRDLSVIEVQKWEALAKCVKWAVNVKKDPCRCYTTCSGLDIDMFTWSDARDELLKLLPDVIGGKISSCAG